MSAQTLTPDAALLGPVSGQWRPADPNRRRTSKQRKRELRKDRSRRRRILERAQCDPTLTHLAVRVLDVLLKHSDDTGARVWPKMITLALSADVAVRSARRCVAELETAGYVMRFMRPVKGRRNLSNLYYFPEPPRGAVACSRPNQRRKPRLRRSDRGTVEAAGTTPVVIEPSPAGAAKPAPPPRKPGWRRDMPPSPRSAAVPKPFAPAEPRVNPPDEAERSAARASIAEIRALLEQQRATETANEP